MKTDQLTFNDLPAVVGELCDRIASMENLLTEKLSKQHEVKENTHVPMTVQEACAYLKMPLSTFYYKVKKMIFQSSSKGNIYTSTGMNWTNGWNPPERIRLRKLSRKRTKPCSLPIAVNLTLKTGNDGEDGRNDTFT